MYFAVLLLSSFLIVCDYIRCSGRSLNQIMTLNLVAAYCTIVFAAGRSKDVQGRLFSHIT